MSSKALSVNALALIRHHGSGLSLLMTDANPEALPGLSLEETLAAYAELVADGLMIKIDTSGTGKYPRYWLTLAAMERRPEWQVKAPAPPAAAARPVAAAPSAPPEEPAAPAPPAEESVVAAG